MPHGPSQLRGATKGQWISSPPARPQGARGETPTVDPALEKIPSGHPHPHPSTRPFGPSNLTFSPPPRGQPSRSDTRILLRPSPVTR